MPHLLSPRRPRGRPGERRGDAALPGGGSKRENPSNRRPHRPDTRARSRSVGSTGSTGSNSSNVSIQKERRAAAPGLHLELLRTIKVTEKGSPRPPTSRSRSSRHLSRGSQSGSDELSKGERQQGVPNLRRLSVVVRTSCRSPGPHLSDSVLNASSAHEILLGGTEQCRRSPAPGGVSGDEGSPPPGGRFELTGELEERLGRHQRSDRRPVVFTNKTPNANRT